MPQINKETKNSQSLRRHAKQLKELHQFNLELPGKITDYLDSNLTPVTEMVEKVAESAIVSKLDVYRKAKKMGEEFAREITD